MNILFMRNFFVFLGIRTTLCFCSKQYALKYSSILGVKIGVSVNDVKKRASWCNVSVKMRGAQTLWQGFTTTLYKCKVLMKSKYLSGNLAFIWLICNLKAIA